VGSDGDRDVDDEELGRVKTATDPNRSAFVDSPFFDPSLFPSPTFSSRYPTSPILNSSSISPFPSFPSSLTLTLTSFTSTLSLASSPSTSPARRDVAPSLSSSDTRRLCLLLEAEVGACLGWKEPGGRSSSSSSSGSDMVSNGSTEEG
jgi:hypothetical protein